MNFLTRLKLKLETDNKEEYMEKLRKKQAKELGIADHAQKVAASRGRTDHDDTSTKKFDYLYESDGVKIRYKRRRGLSTKATIEIRYDGERVFWAREKSIQRFKPCEWIDHIVKKSKEIDAERERKEKEKKRDKWGIGRDCDSKIFNMFHEV